MTRATPAPVLVLILCAAALGAAAYTQLTHLASVPGLHFVGLSSARSFGPVMRFVVGAVHPARTLTRLFGASRASRRASVAATAWN